MHDLSHTEMKMENSEEILLVAGNPKNKYRVWILPRFFHGHFEWTNQSAPFHYGQLTMHGSKDSLHKHDES